MMDMSNNKTLRELRKETLRAFLDADSDHITCDEADLVTVTSHSTADDDDDSTNYSQDGEGDDDGHHNVSMAVVQSILSSISLISVSETTSESFPLSPDSVCGYSPTSSPRNSMLCSRADEQGEAPHVPVKEEKAPLIAYLSSEDRQALWLIWTTLQIHSDDVVRLEEEGAIGRSMLRKLYDWNPARVRQCLQCPPEGRGGILAEMARHVLAIRMGNLGNNILREVRYVIVSRVS